MNYEQLAKIYLNYQGLQGTQKQIAKFLKNIPFENLVLMCKQRGLIK